MPLFDYKCHGCGAVVEADSRRLDTLTCPGCGGKSFERLFSPPNLVRGPAREAGHTCCGRTERCDKPPCSSEGGSCCGRD